MRNALSTMAAPERYEIHEHVEEVLDFWKGMLERCDVIDMNALIEEN